MAFKTQQPANSDRDYKINMNSKNGNKVATVYLASTFLKAMLGTVKGEPQFTDVTKINKGDLSAYLESLDIEIEQEVEGPTTSVEDY